MTRSLLFLAFALLLGCQDDSERTFEPYSLTWNALGTTWTVKVLSYQPIDESKLRTDLAAKIEEAEQILSHWRPDASLYLLNASLSYEPIPIPPSLHELLKHAKWTYKQTGGAFDPTIATLPTL